jgi:hypothetical protein
MRALYGLLLTTTQLAASPKCSAVKKKEYMALAIWSNKQVSARQAGAGRELASDLAVLKSLMGDLDVRD